MYLYFKNNEPNLGFYNDYISGNITNVDDLFLQNVSILKEFSIECIEHIPESKFLYPICFGNFENLNVDWVKFIDTDVIECVRHKKAKILLISLENETFFDIINAQIIEITKFWNLGKDDIVCLVNNGHSYPSLNCFSPWLDEFEMFINNRELKIEKSFGDIKYYFESLSNTHKEHRYKLSKKIFDNGISCCLSYNELLDEDDSSDFYYSLPQKNVHDVTENFSTNKCIDETPSHLLTAIHIINETFDDNDTNFSYCPLTEKTLKPVMVGRPFLINGPTQSHQHLESLGYKKHRFIDYTFDTIVDNQDRIECLWQEILRLHSIPLNRLLEKIKKDFDILDHNRQTLEARAIQHINFIHTLENF
jgi:hypothetical protein